MFSHMTKHPSWMNFKNIFCFLLSVLLSLTTYASNKASEKESVKTETELHLAISQEAFNHIIASHDLALAGEQRTDFYFDAHDGEKFLMRANIAPAKLRIQKREQGFISQKSWIKQQSVLHSSGFNWLYTTRISAASKHQENGQTSKRLILSQEVLETAVQTGVILPSEKKEFASLWKPHSWPKLPEFDHVTSKFNGQIIPAAIVHKERWLLQISTLRGDVIDLQLGRDSDVLGHGLPQAFEIEAELKTNSTLKDAEIVDATSEWLLALGISPTHTSPRTSHNFFERLEKLYP